MINKELRLKELAEKKNEIGDERDLCAEVYNVWITRLYDFQEDPAKYKMYLDLISALEPYGNRLKEEIREINREICRLENVESIEETKFFRKCNNKHGHDRPNADL